MQQISWVRRTATIRTAAIGLLLALALISSAAAQGPASLPPAGLVPPSVRKILGPVETPDRGRELSADQLMDAGDHYFLAPGERIGLLRAKGEVAVRFAETLASTQGLQRLQGLPGVPPLESAGHVTLRARGRVDLVRSADTAKSPDVKSIAASAAVVYAYPVLVDPESRCRMIPTDEVLVRLPDGIPLADVQPDIAAAGLTLVERTGTRRMQVYLLRLVDPKKNDALTASRQLAAGNKVLWAEPNFIREVRLGLTPNDSLFSTQQYLHNTGQNGGTSDADLDGPEAWDDAVGNSSIVIAIIDDGVDLNHADLSIHYNPGESGGGKETNNTDDDGNGKIDDWRGWDFANGDNNSSPTGTNGHGTGCAGVAAAVGNNSYRIAGTAYGCKVFPVKIISDAGVFTTNQIIGDAISYAADFADVLSNSWGGGGASSFINNAIDDATNNGRAGKGCPVFFSTGNSASTWYQGGGRERLSTSGLSGSYYFGFFYRRGGSSGGENAVRVDNVCLLDSDGYTHKTATLTSQNFEGTFPPSGWWLARGGGAASDWSRSSVNTLTGTGGTYSACSPSLSVNQYAWLFTPLMSISGNETFAFACSASMPTTSYFYVDVYDSAYTYIGSWGPWNGVPSTITSVSYPASYTNSIAVGASTDCDYRSDYSQYGTGLQFVAPSNGGWNDIATLDPTGSVGWTATDYKMSFGGTSSACPTAAGVAALILSKNHHLFRNDVLYVMKRTCDKIGGVAYDSDGWNQYYGYGRLNADAALALTGPHNSTAVEMVSFAANQYGSTVLLEWRTGYEVDNLGFHIYRDEGGRLERVTPELVAGSALLAGAGTKLTAGGAYSWWDVLPPGAGKVQYWLEDVDLNGKRARHGPVEPVVSDKPLPDRKQAALLAQLAKQSDETLSRIHQVQTKLNQAPTRGLTPSAQRIALSESRPLTHNSKLIVHNSMSQQDVQWWLAGQPAVKLNVRQEGWHRVGRSDLLAAGLSPTADPRFLQLYVKGEEQPILVTGEKDGRFDPNDAIEFYGVGQDTPWTDAQTYWLAAGSRRGKRIPTIEPRSRDGKVAENFFATVERKDRTVYFAALKNGEADNFFGPVVSSEGANQLLNTPHLAPTPSGEAIVEVALQGATAGLHRVSILLNTVEVGTAVFDGQSGGVAKISVPQSILLEGDNLVRLVAQGGETDISLADCVRLSYWRAYVADGDSLRCTAPGDGQVTLEGFSGPHITVVDITNAGAPQKLNGTVQRRGASYAITVKAPKDGRRTLLAAADSGRKQPAAIAANQPSRWHQAGQQADVAVIAHEAFLKGVEPLKTLREAQGLTVALIAVEDLYDEFNFGSKSAWALRDFLAQAQAYWRKPPRFVLLVGDASVDPRNYLGLGEGDFVPTKLVETALLETASDDWFADLNSDEVPEMAVGRLPVRTAAEAAAVVSKIVGYELAAGEDWAKKVLLVADNNDAFDFEAASVAVGSLLPVSVAVEGVFLGWTDLDLARSMLLEKLNGGQLLVNYIGHGSLDRWAGEGLLTSEDAEALTNSPRLPFVISMTCLNGFLHDPATDSLAEALLKAEQGGAVAVWASSGLTEPQMQTDMDKELVRQLFNGTSPTLGEATRAAKTAIGFQDLRRTWILLGDPATRLK